MRQSPRKRTTSATNASAYWKRAPWRAVKLLLAFLGMVVTMGEWRGLVALALALVAFARKSTAEEERMRQTFPEYELYQRETAALIPFVY